MLFLLFYNCMPYLLLCPLTAIRSKYFVKPLYNLILDFHLLELNDLFVCLLFFVVFFFLGGGLYVHVAFSTFDRSCWENIVFS